MTDKIKKWVREEIRSLSAYHVPDASGFVKLDAMENPYHWPEAMVSEWLDVLRDVELNRYPDPSAGQLTKQLREAMDVPEDAEILLGNGSDELIQMIMMALSGEGRSVLSLEPGFVMYRMIAIFTHLHYVGVPLRNDFSLDTEALLQAIEEHQPAVVFIAYPNNPTGNLFDETTIRKVIEAAPGLVILDEAYHAFAGHSFMPYLAEYDNLLVMRTVSKMGLAGLRLGLLAGNAQWLRELDKVRLPYNINVLTQASALFALRHKKVLDTQTAQICRDREGLLVALQALPGLTVYPSKANFILIRVPQGRADALFAGLREQHILIKNLNAAGGLLKDCLRITVGTADENEKFLSVFSALLQAEA